ncbi:serine/arginine-rich splicing factor 11 isoform X2 [Pan paniscus]|uniref:serine/arginine-rich splicing factor 11 isoform X2 n=1 Tax=Pan paniscus TaxID=9597 RepID=UPI003006982B
MSVLGRTQLRPRKGSQRRRRRREAHSAGAGAERPTAPAQAQRGPQRRRRRREAHSAGAGAERPTAPAQAQRGPQRRRRRREAHSAGAGAERPTAPAQAQRGPQRRRRRREAHSAGAGAERPTAPAQAQRGPQRRRRRREDHSAGAGAERTTAPAQAQRGPQRRRRRREDHSAGAGAERQKAHEGKEPNVHLKPGVHLGSDVQLKTGIPPGAEESTQGLVLNWGLMTTRGQGAVASMFWVDAELGSDVYLDGIITIVDSKYGLKHLTEEKPDGLINEATRQVALADIILINKTDLVPEEDVKKLRTTIRSINGLGQILETQRSRLFQNHWPVRPPLDCKALQDKIVP